MAKVTIYTRDGGVSEKRTKDKEETEFYENLPFRTESVMRTEVTEIDEDK